ncbi:hypothetical protein ACLD72_004580 [Paenibacillus sp. TH7-28]
MASTLPTSRYDSSSNAEVAAAGGYDCCSSCGGCSGWRLRLQQQRGGLQRLEATTAAATRRLQRLEDTTAAAARGLQRLEATTAATTAGAAAAVVAAAKSPGALCPAG